MNSRKREVLRAVSINNDEHLFNLKDNEGSLKQQNYQLVKNFIEKLESAKFNVKSNISKNFLTRIEQIWNSYFNEQITTKKITFDKQKVVKEVNDIKNIY